MSVRMYSLFCTKCLQVWFSSHRDRKCPFCHAYAVSETEKP